MSARNPRLAGLAALCHKRAAREEHGAFVLEGPVAVADAVRRGAQLLQVFVAADALDLADVAAGTGAEIYAVDARRLTRCLSTVTPRPVAAVAALPPRPTAVPASTTAVLVLVGLADPGNLGTLVRTAEAAGFGAVVCCDDAVDPFNPKAVRASAGAICTLPVITERTSVNVLDELAALGYRRVGTRAGAASSYHDADLSAPVALVLGNEAHGLPGGLQGYLEETVRIPMAGSAESLNVAAAGAVLCFEVARRRESGR